MELEPINKGYSNKIYIIKGEPKKLLRIFGENTNLLVNRELENEIMSKLCKYNLCPKILEILENGRIEEYLENFNSMEIKNLENEELLNSMVKSLKQLHNVEKNKNKEAVIFKRINEWTRYAEQINSNFSNYYGKMNKLIEYLIKNQQEFSINLCHNDLTLDNIMFKDNEVRFIDTEYSDYNFVEFEIANMTNELEIDYNEKDYIKKNPEIDNLTVKICRLYCQDEESYQKLIGKLPYFKMISHYIWAVWSIIKSSDKNIQFDYIKHAEFRFNRFIYYFNKLIV
jgi:thiamine kinase-like enzyme